MVPVQVSLADFNLADNFHHHVWGRFLTAGTGRLKDWAADVWHSAADRCAPCRQSNIPTATTICLVPAE